MTNYEKVNLNLDFPLTQKEYMSIKLCLAGYTQKEAAKVMEIHYGTFRKHLCRAIKKLEACTAMQAVGNFARLFYAPEYKCPKCGVLLREGRYCSIDGSLAVARKEMR